MISGSPLALTTEAKQHKLRLCLVGRSLCLWPPGLAILPPLLHQCSRLFIEGLGLAVCLWTFDTKRFFSLFEEKFPLTGGDRYIPSSVRTIETPSFP